MQLKPSINKKLQQGFTLVELLIVVIILAILAAIIVPQYASTTTDAKIASLDSTLSNMRAAIDLYYQQHAAYPGGVASTGAPGTCTSAVTGGAVNTQAAILEQLAYYTNAAGQACKMQGTDGSFKYGPYLKKDTLPTNPITNSSALVISTTGILGIAGDGAGLGWKYDTKSGQFIANDTNADPTGKIYDKH
jgi:general secretion pathway protein G